MASKFIGKPSAPRLNLEGNIGCRDSLLHTKHPMQTLYETMSTPLVRDTRLLNATVLPILIKDRRLEMTSDVTTAFTGTSRVGLTWEMVSTVGSKV